MRSDWSRHMRRVLYDDAGGLCCYCGRKTLLVASHKDSGLLATIEHIIPRSWGGPNRRNNLALACQRCNSNRGLATARCPLPPERLPRSYRRDITELAKMEARRMSSPRLRYWGLTLRLDTIRAIRRAYNAGEPPSE